MEYKKTPLNIPENRIKHKEPCRFLAWFYSFRDKFEFRLTWRF